MKSIILKPSAYAVMLAAALSPTLSSAQNYPNKVVRVIVPFAPGGGQRYHRTPSVGQTHRNVQAAVCR